MKAETKRTLRAALLAVALAGAGVVLEAVLYQPFDWCANLTNSWARWWYGCEGWLPWGD